jgi:hypothetical protein
MTLWQVRLADNPAAAEPAKVRAEATAECQ